MSYFVPLSTCTCTCTSMSGEAVALNIHLYSSNDSNQRAILPQMNNLASVQVMFINVVFYSDLLFSCRCGFKTVERSGRNARRRRTCSDHRALSSRRRVCRRSAPSTTRRSSTSPRPPREARRRRISRRRARLAGACTDTTTTTPLPLHCPTVTRALADRPPADHRRCTRHSSRVTRCSARRPDHITTVPGRWPPLPDW